MLKHIIDMAKKKTDENVKFALKRKIFDAVNHKFSRGNISLRTSGIVSMEDINSLRYIANKIIL